MIKAIIFGMVGVIYDATLYIQKARDTYLARFGVKRSIKDIEETLGQPLQYQLDVLNKKFNISLDYEEFSRETRKLQLELMKGKIKPVAGLLEFLAELKNNGIKVGIASFNIRKNVEEDLTLLGLSDIFDIITTFEEVKMRKPNPEILLKTAEKLGVHPSECVYIDDSALGIQQARNAGMKSCIRRTIFDQQLPDLVIQDFSELDSKIIQRL